MRVRGEEPRPPTSARPAWTGLLVAALVCAVLTAALGGCPRMRALAGSAVDASHRPLAAAGPRVVAGARNAAALRAVTARTRETAGPRCHGDGPAIAVTPAPVPGPRAHAYVSNGTHRGPRASAPPPAPEPPSPRRLPDGRPEPPLRV
ncbi:hypothetical protein [Streptomyces malaysiense]|uniref:Uncharacterized protein n=1 Tax=Streptomyces malaysiense TaxID=1428626 RepID=A0A1J4PZ49_9ACTN|nr:hypothetical protein [Streptomyces malaysiense]OIK26025.1 hypothetical protein VT52_018595 [Streptomyces malaysiense]